MYRSIISLMPKAPAFDADAQAYITAVETADRQALEAGVRTAINDFVVGCKADGIWDAIKASCIMAGARTLTGALVPLKGTAPTNYNFVPGDYNRKTGLVGDGSSKNLNSNGTTMLIRRITTTLLLTLQHSTETITCSWEQQTPSTKLVPTPWVEMSKTAVSPETERAQGQLYQGHFQQGLWEIHAQRLQVIQYGEVRVTRQLQRHHRRQLIATCLCSVVPLRHIHRAA
jgi:hypothetical protein